MLFRDKIKAVEKLPLTVHDASNFVQSFLILGNSKSRVEVGLTGAFGFNTGDCFVAELETLGTVTRFEVALRTAALGSRGAL